MSNLAGAPFEAIILTDGHLPKITSIVSAFFVMEIKEFRKIISGWVFWSDLILSLGEVSW
jgi:hypothetical protein